MNIQRSVNQLLAVGAGIKLARDQKMKAQANEKVKAQKDKATIAKSKESIAKSKLETLKARTEYKAIKQNPQAYLEQAQDKINLKYQQAQDFENRKAIVKAGIPENSPLFSQALEKIKGAK